ncbi:hypothetical protein [Paracoccus aerodenitrificans]|uniref:hypothetical protein n=1 Tax=Paracoccus aerodenitrificans TaxID=3017781 RepID=UPI0022F0DF35|nr:hypothetical protein [Paracoccus aerodenitrificans]WBU63462.1 hypothetical protein PAE61_14020 [Paracoccus aerodenitrificans]
MARSDLYIAGQTAPGYGIQLRMRDATHGPLIIKNASDVVARFLKLRPGPGSEESPAIDALTVENASRLYLGNLSMMFASDETFNIHVSGGEAVDITLADSILAYSLDNSNHPEGKHSKGALICSDEGKMNECGRISLLRNIFAHHRDRNPDIKATSAGPVEVINNIFYDPISQFGEFYDLIGETRIAYIGNVAIAGPSTSARAGAAVELFDWTDGNPISVWAEGNEARSCKEEREIAIIDPAMADFQTSTRFALTVDPMPVGWLMERIPATAGDALPDRRHRDELDKKVLGDLANCRGHVIDSPEDVGGWTDIGGFEPDPDRDGDLLPDEWEAATEGLDPDRKDDPWADPDGDGMTTVETWLAALAGDE